MLLRFQISFSHDHSDWIKQTNRHTESKKLSNKLCFCNRTRLCAFVCLLKRERYEVVIYTKRRGTNLGAKRTKRTAEMVWRWCNAVCVGLNEGGNKLELTLIASYFLCPSPKNYFGVKLCTCRHEHCTRSELF